jgi:CheY-like chemotaxis protein
MARQRSPKHAPIAINDVVTAALDLTEFRLQSHGVRLERNLAPDLPVIMADADQLHQVVVNLIVNAQQAMEGHSGKRRLTVATGYGVKADTLRIEVSDTGPGVPQELRRRIFEPFFTTKPQEKGTGVGLSFSQGIVEAHGGRLDVQDSGLGATFVVELPVSTGAECAESTECLVSPPTHGKSALVVDDEEDIAEALGELLELEGYRCSVALGGIEAQGRLHTEEYDLIISDLRMPELDGTALYEWLQRTRPQLLARFAFSTGDALSPSTVRFLARVQRPLLEKPFTRAALRRLLDEISEARAT